MIKNTLVAASCAILLTAQAARAGGMAEPVMEPEVIAEETSGTSGFIVPLILLAVIAAVLLIDDGGSEPVTALPG